MILCLLSTIAFASDKSFPKMSEFMHAGAIVSKEISKSNQNANSMFLNASLIIPATGLCFAYDSGKKLWNGPYKSLKNELVKEVVEEVAAELPLLFSIPGAKTLTKSVMKDAQMIKMLKKDSKKNSVMILNGY